MRLPLRYIEGASVRGKRPLRLQFRHEVAKKLNGKIEGDKAMAILKGMKITSPRGPIMIDPETRDVLQTVYIRKVEKVNGEPYNVEFDKFANVKDLK